MTPVSKFLVIIAVAKETVKFTYTAEEGKAHTRQCKLPVTVVWSVRSSDVIQDRSRNSIKIRSFWLLVFLDPLLTVCYVSVTDMQFLIFFFLFCSLFILIFFVLSYFSSLSLYGNFSDTSPRNTVITVTESKFIIFQHVMTILKRVLCSATYMYHGTTAPTGPGPRYRGFMITLSYARHIR